MRRPWPALGRSATGGKKKKKEEREKKRKNIDNYSSTFSRQPIVPIFKSFLSQTTVNNYYYTLCNCPEERISHLNSGESLKSPIKGGILKVKVCVC
jgi:hypothetical protein